MQANLSVSSKEEEPIFFNNPFFKSDDELLGWIDLLLEENDKRLKMTVKEHTQVLK